MVGRFFSIQKAITKFINGRVTPTPDKAYAPTPLPIKILSTAWYSEVTVMPIMAGIEYSANSFPIGAVPKICGDVLAFIILIRIKTYL